MSDIVERLRAVDHMSVEDCFLQSHLFSLAADTITSLRSQLEEARENVNELSKALAPFATFAQVMDTAGDDKGHSSICLYAGKPPAGGGIIERADDMEISIFERLDDEACLFGTVGGWSGVAASFMCPVLQAKHFRAAAIRKLKEKP